MKLGELLRMRREAMMPALTQSEAASRAGISDKTWQGTEAGKRTPSPKNLAHMAHVVGLAPGDLEQCGQSAAAEILRTIRAGERSMTNDDVEGHISRRVSEHPDSAAYAALMQAQIALAELGWSVTVQPVGDGAIDVGLRRNRHPAGTGAVR